MFNKYKEFFSRFNGDTIELGAMTALLIVSLLVLRLVRMYLAWHRLFLLKVF